MFSKPLKQFLFAKIPIKRKELLDMQNWFDKIACLHGLLSTKVRFISVNLCNSLLTKIVYKKITKKSLFYQVAKTTKRYWSGQHTDACWRHCSSLWASPSAWCCRSSSAAPPRRNSFFWRESLQYKTDGSKHRQSIAIWTVSFTTPHTSESHQNLHCLLKYTIIHKIV